MHVEGLRGDKRTTLAVSISYSRIILEKKTFINS